MTNRQIFDGTPLDVAGDSSSPRAVIVIQEAFGVNDHIREVTDRFAQAGYYAVAPELFHRAGSPEIDYDDFPGAMAAMSEINADGIAHDLDAASSFLTAAGFAPSSTGIVGYCMGGTVTFFAATQGRVGVAASFYGGGIDVGRFGFPPLLELAPQLQVPWIGLYGDLDKGIPVQQVEALRLATAASNHDTMIVRYADAEHGFHCDGRPAVFNRDDAVDAHNRTLDFFAAHLSKR
ncbi:MAG: dienelactone hydrolase family protein [Acidimicrobiaceae bacterium]|nr:dienelactone hydrolase family protein [Acidimicrobiaceae bacterium]